MGFSWTPITQYVTEVAAAHINQVKANVDSVYTDLELSAYNWLYLPVSVGDERRHEDFKEMRDAIDYADDMNYCRSHDASYMGTDYTDHRGTVYTGENTGYDSGYKAGVDGDYNTGYKLAHLSYAKSEVQTAVDYGDDVGYKSSEYGTYHGTYNTGYLHDQIP